MNWRLVTEYMFGICATVFFLEGPSYCFSTPSASTDAHQSHVIALRELSGSMYVAKLVGDRIVSPVRRIGSSKHWAGLAMSPDGKTLAYTSYSGREPSRRSFVELMDLGTGKARRVTAIPSDHSHSLSWSHDGRCLAVKLRVAPTAWRIGTVAPDGTNFQSLAWAALCGGSAVWGQTDTSFYYADLDSLYEVDLRGMRTRNLLLKTVIPEGLFFAPMTVDVLHNEDTLLIETQLRDNQVQWCHENGRGAVYEVSMSKGVARRVGPHDMSAREPAWVDRNRYLFLGIPLTEENRAAINQDKYVPDNLYLGHIDSAVVSMLRERIWEYSVSSASPSMN